MGRRTRCYRYDFRGELAVAGVGSGVGNPWVKDDDSSSGSPTVAGATGGGIALTLASTTEAENLCLYFGDVLSFDIDDLIRFSFAAKTVAALDTTTSIAMGLASARNDAIDSIAEAALFRLIGDNNVVVETDDGTNNNDDVSAGMTLGANWKRFEINFAERNSTMEPPSVSLGRKSNVGFYMSDDLGSLRRVASGTRFDMSNYTGGLQPFFQIQKTSDANTDSVTILEVEVEVNLPI